jgi:catechol 2,3-dioxygenase-like lactoylglutathione lyase family enzyme
MPDLFGPDFVTLLVRDLDASHHFYTEVLGLKESTEKRPNAFCICYAAVEIRNPKIA